MSEEKKIILPLDFSIETLSHLEKLAELTDKSLRETLFQRALRWYEVSFEKWMDDFKEIEFRSKKKKPKSFLLSDVLNGLIGNIAQRKDTTPTKQLRLILEAKTFQDLVLLTKKANQPSKESTTTRALGWYDFSVKKHFEGFDKIEFKNNMRSTLSLSKNIF